MNNAVFIIIAHLTLRMNLKGIDLVRKLLVQPMNLEKNKTFSCRLLTHFKIIPHLPF